MTAEDEGKVMTEQLEQMIQLLESIRVLLATGVPRDKVSELRDDVQSLTSAVQILSKTLERRLKKKKAATELIPISPMIRKGTITLISYAQTMPTTNKKPPKATNRNQRRHS